MKKLTWEDIKNIEINLTKETMEVAICSQCCGEWRKGVVLLLEEDTFNLFSTTAGVLIASGLWVEENWASDNSRNLMHNIPKKLFKKYLEFIDHNLGSEITKINVPKGMVPLLKAVCIAKNWNIFSKSFIGYKKPTFLDCFKIMLEAIREY